MKIFPWPEVENHVRIGVYLLAATAQSLVFNDKAAITAIGKAAFGPTAPAGGRPIVSEVNEVGDLDAYDVSATALYVAAKACHELVEDRARPLDEIDYDYIRDEFVSSLGFFLQAIPRDTYLTPLGGGDYSEIFSETGREFPLPNLNLAASAKLNLAQFIHSYRSELEHGIGFSPYEIAALSGMSIGSVRNVVGKGDKAEVKAMPTSGKEIYADPLDTLEWLAGRRQFNPGPVRNGWFSNAAAEAKTPIHIGAVLGIFAWVNKVTTFELAKHSDLTVDEVRKWTRGDLSGGLEYAEKLALAAGADVETYATVVGRIASITLKPQGTQNAQE